ncbi:MAG: DEAD/DEAH box helicase [Cystobacterineae bacterium]|nr:DEAD/DEAH box helicase [Cystobacterineae bacterium]
MAVTFETDKTTDTSPSPEAQTTSELALAETPAEATAETSAEAPAETSAEATSYVADVSFESLGLSQETLRALAERGYRQPTPVQAQAFQPAFQGKDLIVRSKTGTGKTAAFGLPLLERIPKGTCETEALILCPTRELASQVATELGALSQYRDIQIAAIYGGASMKLQEAALEKGAAIVVGTPGRIQDHMRRGNLKLHSCRHIVLDEADEMLNQGFYEEVTHIIEALPPERQVLLFSATVSDDIRRLIMRHTHEPQTLLLSKDVFTVEHIHHVRYDVDDAFPKPRNLLYVLEIEQPENAIIFCNTRDDTELVVAVLNRNGLDAELLNGDLPQKERERVMAKVKSGELAFMVATDLAARGIDISDLGHVINYSLPEDPSVYLHRVGRTGRIGKKGVAINLVSGRELSSYSALEKKYGIPFEKRPMPAPQVALEMWTDRHVREIKEAASTTVYEGFLGLATGLKQRSDADELVAFLLRYFFWHQRKTKAQQSQEEQQASPKHAPKHAPHEAQKGRESREGRDRKGKERGRSRDERRPPREARNRPPRPPAAAMPAPLAMVDTESLASSPAPNPPLEDTAPTDSCPTENLALLESTPPEETTPATKGKRHLSDRELFEALQSGQPLPWIEDPTVGSKEEHREPREPREPREHRERSSRRSAKKQRPQEPLPEGMARLWINLGTQECGTAENFCEALSQIGVSTEAFQLVDLHPNFSFVLVAEDKAADMESFTGTKILNKSLKIERAKWN